MSPTLAVRRATAVDVAALAALEHEAREAITDSRGGAALLADRPAVGDWDAALADPGRAVWVATIDEVVLGVLELRFPLHPGGAGEVRQVYVVPGARELGLGDDMLAAAIEATMEAGGVAIEAVALPGDRETKNLFERSGMTARLITVSKRLA
jgi:ribosomal protein S18 acetylase RimI-like enzyme